MMRNIFILLCCSLLLFVFVWQTNPEFIAQEMPSLVGYRFTMPIPPVPAPKAEAAKPAGTSGRTVHQPAAPVAESAETETATVVEIPAPAVTPEPAPPVHKPAPIPPVFSVNTDGAGLYLSNSSDSRILMVLKKGDVVKPQYQFNNQGQEWTFVNLANTAASGFIRTGAMDRKEMDKKEPQETASADQPTP